MKKLLLFLLVASSTFAQTSNWALYRRDTVSLVPTKYWVTTNYTIPNGTSNQIYGMNSGGTAKEWKTFSGTTDQITLTHEAGTLGFSLPQSIATTSNPSFANMNVTTAYKIGNTNVLTSNTLGSGVTSSSLTSVGTIGTGVWQGTPINGTYINYNTTNLKVTSNQLNTIQDIASTSSPSFAGLGLTGNVTQTGNYSFLNNFVSGIIGTGWRVNYDGTKSYLELDNLTVRNTLRTHIFQKDIVKVTNGILYISDSGIISSIDAANNRVGFLTSQSATFTAGMQIWIKDANNTGTIISVKFTVVSVYSTSGGQTVYNVTVNEGSLSSLVIGMTGARISGGYLVADASSANSPFLDIWNGTTHRARLGNLAGVNDAVYGGLAGYGLYTNNAYFRGNVNIAGTLTAGDENGFGNAFYAGKILRNLCSGTGLTGYTTDDALISSCWVGNPPDIYAFGSGTGVYQESTTNSLYTMWDGVPVRRIYISSHQGDRTVISLTNLFTINYVAGKTYLLSFYIKANKNITGNYQAYDNTADLTTTTLNPTNIKTTWQRVVAKIECINSRSTGELWFIVTLNDELVDNDWIAFTGFQLEETTNLYPSPYQRKDNITSSSLNYGMWAYKGGFGGTIQNPKISLSDNGLVIRKDDAGSSTWLGDNTISVGYSAAAWGIVGKSGANKVFELGSTNQIAGWTFDNEKLLKGSSSAAFVLNTSATPYINQSTGKGFEIYDAADPKFFIGKKDGVQLDWNVTTANAFTLKSGANERLKFNADGSGFLASNNINWDTGGNTTIAGWSIGSDKITKGTASLGFSLNTGATPFITGKGFEVYDVSSPKLFIGDKAGSSLDYNVTNSNVLTLKGDITSTATITGGVIQTAATGDRVVISSSGNSLRFITADGYTNVSLAAGSSPYATGEFIMNYAKTTGTQFLDYFLKTTPSTLYMTDYFTDSAAPSTNRDDMLSLNAQSIVIINDINHRSILIKSDEISITDTDNLKDVIIKPGEIKLNGYSVPKFWGVLGGSPPTGANPGDYYMGTNGTIWFWSGTHWWGGQLTIL